MRPRWVQMIILWPALIYTLLKVMNHGILAFFLTLSPKGLSCPTSGHQFVFLEAIYPMTIQQWQQKMAQTVCLDGSGSGVRGPPSGKTSDFVAMMVFMLRGSS